VVPGTFRDYLAAHPSRPVLVVEVSETSLALDRVHKGSLYARAGLPDYWIVNLQDHALEVYRNPEPNPGAPFGWRYRSASIMGPGTSVTPLARPDGHVQIIDLLP
jgi:Uma2 family endonuclease